MAFLCHPERSEGSRYGGSSPQRSFVAASRSLSSRAKRGISVREIVPGEILRRAQSALLRMTHSQSLMGHFMIGMPKLAAGFTPSRQREVTVLMRV